MSIVSQAYPTVAWSERANVVLDAPIIAGVKQAASACRMVGYQAENEVLEMVFIVRAVLQPAVEILEVHGRLAS